MQAGRLRVAEKAGRALDVVVDGNVVGVTPWRAPSLPGDHAVMLRGEDRFGSPASPVSIRAGARAELLLEAEELDAAMRVEPSPAEASVAIDGLFVGRGPWDGRIRPGAHKVLVVADGYFKADRSVTLDRGGRGVVVATLDRDPRSPRWRKPGRFLLEASGTAAISPSFGTLGTGCTARCAEGLGAGGHAMLLGGYELGAGFGFGAEVGYLRMTEATSTGPPRSRPSASPSPRPGTADDTRRLRSFLVGGWAGFGFGERLRFHLRLGAGVALGTISDTRTGTFTAANGAPFDVGPLIQVPSATWFYLDPELRLGLRLGGHVELSAGVGLNHPHRPLPAPVGIPPSPSARAPTVRDPSPLNPLMSPVIFAVTPRARCSLRFLTVLSTARGRSSIWLHTRREQM